MQTVEYARHYLPTMDYDLLKKLNELGEEGWILCSDITESSALGEGMRLQCVAMFYRNSLINSR